MTSTIKYVPQVDYTSRDYISISNDLISLARQFNPEWTSTNPADMGVTLLELFAYLGDLLNFYIDRAANEGFLATASQRESILQIAGILGYTSSPMSPSSTTLTFTNTTGSSITVPALTQVASTAIVNGANTQITFETDNDVTISANSSNTVTATQGTTINPSEGLGTSTGLASQIFRLKNQPVSIK